MLSGTPTRDEMKQRVQDNFVHFVSDINCHTLSDWLIQHRVISSERWEEIKNTEPTDRRKNRALMNWILDTNHPNAFNVLREALESENYHWLLAVIDQPTKPAVLSNDEIKRRVKANYDSFLTDIDADSLSDWLQTERVITRDRLRQIMRTESTHTKKNRALLDCLFNSSDPNAFTTLRKSLAMENNDWLLSIIDHDDHPLKSSTNVRPETSGHEDLVAEVKQLQEENEELRRKLDEAQTTLKQDKELTQGVKRKEWASSLKHKQLEQDLLISHRRMARNNQVLESLMGKLMPEGSRQVLNIRHDLSKLCSGNLKESSSSRSFTRVPYASTKAKPEQGSSTTMTRGRSESLDVEPADQKSETRTDQPEIKNTNTAAKMQRRDTTQSDSHRNQKDPLIVKLPGYASKAKLCELRIHPGFDGYGFIFETERIGSQLYCHRVDKVECESPADRSGLLPGDRIAEVNGVSVMKKPHNEAIKAMRMFPSRLTLLLADQECGKDLQESAVNQSKESRDAAPYASSDRSLSTTGTKIYYKTTPVSLPTIRTAASQRNDKLSLRICGITTLDNELYIVTTESAEVEIYNSLTCCFVRRWTLEELMTPCDISSCQKNKCLYIMSSVDASQINHILRIASNGILINSFSTGDASAQSLAVTDESHVVVAISAKAKLVEYSSNGQTLREIKLLPETRITHLLHALKLSSDLYLVSHGDEDGGLQRVCIVNTGGHIVKSFGGDLDSKVGEMDGPLHMTVDDEGRIMVTDYGNSRVLLLNSSLAVERILLEKKHGLRLPWRIHLSASQKRLFVSDSEYSFEKEQSIDSKLLVFEVR